MGGMSYDDFNTFSYQLKMATVKNICNMVNFRNILLIIVTMKINIKISYKYNNNNYS